LTRRLIVKGIISAVVLSLMCVDVGGQGEGNNLQKSASSFSVNRISRIDAGLMLAKQRRLPLGIEYAGSKLFELVAAHVRYHNAGSEMRRLFPVGSGFRISTERGVLLISHSEVPASHLNLLDIPLSNLSIPRCSVQEADALLRIALLQALRPNSKTGYGLSISGAGSVKVGPFTWAKVTVREALNRIVREHGRAAWIVQVRPEMLVQPIDPNLLRQFGEGDLVMWTIVEYDSRLFDRIGRITEERALP
jgi:hypothetical protein